MDDKLSDFQGLNAEYVLYSGIVAVTTIEQKAVALSMVRERGDHFDVLVADVAKEDMDCISFLRRIKTIKDDMPVMLMSPRKDINLAERAVKNGVCLFLQKPINDYDIKTLWQHVIWAKRAIAFEREEERSASQERANQENRSERMSIKDADMSINFLDNSPELDCKHSINDTKGKGKEVGSVDHPKSLRVDPRGKKKEFVVETEMAEGHQPTKQVIDGTDHMYMADSDRKGNPKRKGVHGDQKREKRSQKISKNNIGKCHCSTKKPMEGNSKNRRSYASDKKHCNEWDSKHNRRSREAIYRVGSEEFNSPKVYQATNDPNAMIYQVANNVQKFKDKAQELSDATPASGSGRNYITGGGDQNIQKGRNQVPCFGGPRADTKNTRPFPLIPVASLGLQVSGTAGTSCGFKTATCLLDKVDNISELVHSQTPQFTKINNYSKLQTGSSGGLNLPSFTIPTSASQRGSISLLAHHTPALQSNVTVDFHHGTQINPTEHTEHFNKDMYLPAYENRANARDMEIAPCVLEGCSGLHINCTACLSLADQIKQARERYRADNLNSPLLSNRECSKSRAAYNREFNDYVSDTGGRETNASFLPSIAETSPVPLVGGAANSNPGIQNSEITVSHEPPNESLQFCARILSPNMNSLLVNGMNTLVKGLDRTNSQMTNHNAQNTLMATVFPHSLNSGNAEQLSALINGNQLLNMPEAHASSTASLPNTLLTIVVASNNSIQNTGGTSTGLPIEMDSLPPLDATHPISLGYTSIDYPGTQVFGNNQPIFSNTNNQSQVYEMRPEASKSYLHKPDGLNSDGLVPEVQHGSAFTDENLGFTIEDIAAIFNDS
ncbi:hypothetical protein Ancab_021106 [Ancistrocladus abbreviatus]